MDGEESIVSHVPQGYPQSTTICDPTYLILLVGFVDGPASFSVLLTFKSEFLDTHM